MDWTQCPVLWSYCKNCITTIFLGSPIVLFFSLESTTQCSLPQILQLDSPQWSPYEHHDDLTLMHIWNHVCILIRFQGLVAIQNKQRCATQIVISQIQCLSQPHLDRIKKACNLSVMSNLKRKLGTSLHKRHIALWPRTNQSKVHGKRMLNRRPENP